MSESTELPTPDVAVLESSAYPVVGIPRLGRLTNDLEQFEIGHHPSMRFIASLHDIDETFIIGPMGQSGRPGTTHYADMLPAYLNGEMTRLPLSRRGAEKVAVSESQFLPAKL